jgi:hypothetical protein
VKRENLYQRNLNRLRGWTDGAGARSMREQLANDADYQQGYAAGQQAKGAYAEQSAAELGVSVREIMPLSLSAK